MDKESFSQEQPDLTLRLPTGYLSTEETRGNVATKIVVSDARGHWEVPLRGGIDVVNESDRRFIEQPGLDIVSVPGAEVDTIVVRYTGTDGNLRRAEVDVAAARFIEDVAQ